VTDIPPGGQSPTEPGWPDPAASGPAGEEEPPTDPGAFSQSGNRPYGQPGPAGQPHFPPPAPGYGQRGYSQPGPAGQQAYPPPPPGYGQPGGQPGYGPPSGQPGGQPGYSPPYGQPGYGQPGPAGQRGFPPPPPGYGLPRYGRPGYGGWNADPSPGGVPLRPLSLGDILNGAVTLARRNPAATFGLTAIVMTVYGVAAALLGRLYTSGIVNFQQTFQPGQQPTQQQVDDFLNSLVGTALPAILAVAVLALITNAALTGLLSAVIGRGILGQKVSLALAWRTGRVGAVAGATALLFLLAIAVPVPVVAVVVVAALLHLAPVAILLGVVGGIGTLVFWVLLGIRLSLTLPAVVLERVPPRAAIRRSWQLSRGSFWRLLGILLLTYLVVAIAGGVLTIPFTVGELLAGGSGGPGGGFFAASANGSVVVLIISIVGSVVTATVTRPISAGVSVLLYADLRMRREGLDLMLRDAAQNQALTGDEFSAVWQPPSPQQARPPSW